jgi:hypothetical protein
MDSLLYKIKNDPYYCGVEIDICALNELSKNETYVSHMINYVILPDMDNDIDFAMLEGFPGHEYILEVCETTYFVARLPNAPREIELIRAWVDNHEREDHPDDKSIAVINWPTIGSSPISEYNTKGLFDMAFPTLFPKGEVDWLKPRMRNLHLHEYAKHIHKYCDGRHPQFNFFYLISS